MLRRSPFASDPRLALSALLALGATGCLPILGLDGFRVDDDLDSGPIDSGSGDAGSRDGGRTDSGWPDAGCPAPTTYYLDADGDTYGDLATAIEACAPPSERHVERGGDCDDGDASRHPGATEVCDGEDQDCDDAVDEGLIGPMGDPVLVVPDLGVGNGIAADLVAHSAGTTVVWRAQSESSVQAAFIDHEGTILSRVTASEGVARWPAVAMFSAGGVEQVIIAWVQDDGIYAVPYGLSGSAALMPRRIVTTTDAIRLGVRVAAGRVWAVWERQGSPDLHVARFDPALGVASTPLVAMPPSEQQYGTVVAVDGPSLHLLTVSQSEVDGEFLTPPDISLTRLELSPLRRDLDPVPWGAAEYCGGRPGCNPVFSFLFGEGRVGEPSLVAFDTIGIREGPEDLTAEVYAVPMTPQASGPPMRGAPVALPAAALFSSAVVRGPAASLVFFTGSEYAMRDIPLGGSTTGGAARTIERLAPLSFFGTPTLALHLSRGALLGNDQARDGLDVSWVRVGCAP